MNKFIFFVFFIFASNANAVLISSYDFDGDFSDSLYIGADLVPSGGVLDSGKYNFTENQGLRLTTALPTTTEYGIEIKFQVSDNVRGYKKLIDFQDLSSDIGLYIDDDAIKFYPVGPSAGSITVGNDFIVGLGRSDSEISIFLNSVLLFTVADAGQAISASNILNFFEDDVATSQGEAFEGSVDFIRIYSSSSSLGASPVPAPAAIWLFGSGLIGFIGMRKKTAKLSGKYA